MNENKPCLPSDLERLDITEGQQVQTVTVSRRLMSERG